MTITELIAILEDYKHTCLNYKIKVDLDHYVLPLKSVYLIDEFFFDVNDEEKTITIIQRNCGL